MVQAPLFVYGSLKRGFENHRELARARFEAEVVTARGYALFRVGRYPALVRGPPGAVFGELYSADAELLIRLDEFEGCPWLYARLLVELADGRGAFAYLMSPERTAGCLPVPGGRWSEHAR
jgi:gamma-glutamylaminecyclotransferase